MSSLQPRPMGIIPASGAPGPPESSPPLPSYPLSTIEAASFQYGGLTTQDNASCSSFGLYAHFSPCSSIPSPPQSPLFSFCSSLATPARSTTLPSYDACKTETGATWKRANNASSELLEYPFHPMAHSFLSPSPHNCNRLDLHHLPLQVQLGTDFILFPSGPDAAAFRDQASCHGQPLHSLYPTHSIPPIRCPQTPQSPVMCMDNVPQDAHPACSCGVMITLACQGTQVQQHMSYASEIARLPTPDLDDAPEGMFPEW